MRTLKLTLLIAAFVAFSSQAVTVIVHPSNKDALDKDAIKKIYLGKSKKFPSGGEAIPIELSAGESRDVFLQQVVGKAEAQFKAYWSKRVFTGKGQAPRSVDTDAEIIELVSKNPNLIGYINDGAETGAVRVAGKF